MGDLPPWRRVHPNLGELQSWILKGDVFMLHLPPSVQVFLRVRPTGLKRRFCLVSSESTNASEKATSANSWQMLFGRKEISQFDQCKWSIDKLMNPLLVLFNLSIAWHTSEDVWKSWHMNKTWKDQFWPLHGQTFKLNLHIFVGWSDRKGSEVIWKHSGISPFTGFKQSSHLDLALRNPDSSSHAFIPRHPFQEPMHEWSSTTIRSHVSSTTYIVGLRSQRSDFFPGDSFTSSVRFASHVLVHS